MTSLAQNRETTEENSPIRVPYGMTVHGEEEIQAVVDCLRSSTQMGPKVRSFEAKVAESFAKKHGIMVNSGSSALFLAMEIANMPAGSEVITPALTFATTVSSMVKTGLTPVFVDVDEATYCIDVSQIESMITEKTKAICAPNLIGNVANWPEIRKIADKHNLLLIEDSADTLGATLGDGSTGRFSDICITSFYGSHVINAAGNGGMLCVNDDEMARKAILLRSWGRSSSLFAEHSETIENRFNCMLDDIEYDAKFLFEMPGYNLEPSEIGAAFGLVQFDKLQQNIDARVANFDAQYAFCKDYEQWFILPKQLPDTRTGWLAFPITLREGTPFSRKELQIHLEKHNIQTRPVFTGNINRQPGYKDIAKRVRPEGYPEADKVTKGGILLACHHGLTAPMMAHMHETLRGFLSQY